MLNGGAGVPLDSCVTDDILTLNLVFMTSLQTLIPHPTLTLVVFLFCGALDGIIH